MKRIWPWFGWLSWLPPQRPHRQQNTAKNNHAIPHKAGHASCKVSQNWTIHPNLVPWQLRPSITWKTFKERFWSETHSTFTPRFFNPQIILHEIALFGANVILWRPFCYAFSTATGGARSDAGYDRHKIAFRLYNTTFLGIPSFISMIPWIALLYLTKLLS